MIDIEDADDSEVEMGVCAVRVSGGRRLCLELADHEEGQYVSIHLDTAGAVALSEQLIDFLRSQP